MRWLDRHPPPAALICAYCGEPGVFPHAQSFEYGGRDYALFRCPACGSLHYDPPEILVRIEYPYSEAYKENTRHGVKYLMETGYAPELIAYCALAALGGLPPELLADRQFVDVGAGLGLSSLFVREVCGITPVIVEPAYMGELGEALLGLEIHRAFFEDLPEDVLRRLQARPCLLHLNSVVEHLTDPAGPVRQALARVEVDVFAAIVPDAAMVDPATAFAGVLQTLAPGDHLHLPSAEGMRRFMARLGFAHVEIGLTKGLIVAVGARRPIRLPAQAEVAAGADAFLHRLMEHPNSMVAAGAAAGLLHNAAHADRPAEVARLQARLGAVLHRPTLLAQLRSPDPWQELPFHIPVTCYYLAMNALRAADRDEGFAWLDVVDAATARIRADGVGPYTVRALDYGWAARLLRADALARLCRFDEACAIYAEVHAAGADLVAGPSRIQAEGGRRRIAWLSGPRGMLIRARLRLSRRRDLVERPGEPLWLRIARVIQPSALVYYLFYLGHCLRSAVVHRRALAQYVAGSFRYLRSSAIYYGGGAWNAVSLAIRLAPARLLVRLRRTVATHRDSVPVRVLAGLARRLLRAAENAHNADIASNGEAFLLRTVLARHPGEVLDVGARDGPFSARAAALGARVHAFDAGLDQLRVFRARCAGYAVRFNEFIPQDLDAYAAAQCGPAIAVLRIAVPGQEPAILAGCAGLLRTRRIAAIRFAHGPENAPARVFLADLRGTLEASGYRVFHLLPGGLRPLGAEPEDFGGRLYVALAPDLALPP